METGQGKEYPMETHQARELCHHMDKAVPITPSPSPWVASRRRSNCTGGVLWWLQVARAAGGPGACQWVLTEGPFR